MVVKTKLDTMCRTQNSAHEKIMNFRIRLLNYKGFNKVIYPKWHAPTLSKTNWFELENSETIKNKIIISIWKVKIW